MKKLLIVLLFAIGFAGAYYKYKPTVVYLAGRVQAKFLQGKVAGNSVYRLDVAFHRQEHSLSCELASLKMALSGAGIDVPESEIIGALPFDWTPRANGQWGDPYKAFVGSIDGKMMSTGYGVYWDPVARVGLKYRRTQALQGGSLQEIIGHLEQGRPVVVWGYYGNGARYNWTTQAGRAISGVNGEHARTLIGYVGPSHAPQQLILMDPIYGELYWDTQRFMENWGALENGAVVVYKHPRWVKAAGSDVVYELSTDGALKYALNMNWDKFISQGGLGEGIATVDASWLDSLHDGGILDVLPPS